MIDSGLAMIVLEGTNIIGGWQHGTCHPLAFKEDGDFTHVMPKLEVGHHCIYVKHIDVFNFIHLHSCLLIV